MIYKKFLIILCLVSGCVSARARIFDWNESANSPVYGPTNSSDKAYYPCVIYDTYQFSGHGSSNYYKMWYADGNGQYEALVCSSNGIN